MQTDSHTNMYVSHAPVNDETTSSQANTNNTRFRKDHSFNDAASSNETPATSSQSFNIPTNKGSKRYPIQDVFNVWYEVKDQVLNQPPASRPQENYKHSVPKEIYHLNLQKQAQGGMLIQPTDTSSQLDQLYQQSQSLNQSIQGSVPSLEDEMAQMSVGKKLAPPPNLAPPERSNSTDQNLVQPENLFWLYLDPSGNEQGPFLGLVMQEWLTDGYLDFDLRIRRAEESNFYPLKQFCEGVKNYVQPFKVPLPDLTGSQQGRDSLQIPNPPLGDTNQQSAFAASNLYSSLLPNGGNLNLGAASMRMSNSNNLFDFMGSRDYPLMNQPNQFSNNQFAIDPVSMNLGQNLGQNLGPNLGQNLGQNLSGSFGQLHMPSLLQQQIQQQQQPNLSRNNSGWGLDTTGGLMGGNPLTPGAVNTNLAGLGNLGPMSPWLSGVQSVSRVNSPFVPSSSLTGSVSAEGSDIAKPQSDDPVLHDIHSSMVTGILNDDDHRRQPVEETPAEPEQPSEVPYEDPTAKMPGAFIPEPEVEEPQPASPQKSVTEVPTEPTEETVPEQQPEPVKETVKSEVKQEKPALAPWAKKATSSTEQTKPAMTLKEIQALEAARLREEQQIKAEKRQQAALAEAIAISKEEAAAAAAEKPTFNWANNPSQPVVGKKSLAEIQREEAEAAKIKLAANKAAAPAKTSLASSLAASAPKEDNAWTTVVSKKPVPAKKPAPAPVSYSSAAGASTSSISPQMLRAASSTSTNTLTINGNAVREDFLVWARSAMTNLYPSVSKNDLLEIFTTLPAHPDSSQLISETIYSSSATMDGRRFAQEFMKRRQAVDKQVGAGSGENWSAAIVTSADKIPTVDDEGWSTSKTKKKGKKN